MDIYEAYYMYLTKAVTRIYFRGCWGTTQHSLYGRSPKGRGGGGVLGEDAASPLPTSYGSEGAL